MKSEEQFEQLVSRYAGAMYVSALMITRRPQDAEDAAQEALLAAWTHLKNVRNMQSLGAYLVKCSVNAAKKDLRRRRREQPLESVSHDTAAPESGEPIWMYLHALPEKYRLPLALRYGENMSEKEISLALSLPRGTVSSRIARGLKMLRGSMEGKKI